MDASIWQKLRAAYYAFTQYHEMITALGCRYPALKKECYHELPKVLDDSKYCFLDLGSRFDIRNWRPGPTILFGWLADVSNPLTL